MLSKISVLALATTTSVSAGDTNFWKSKAVYQVLTDRFAKDS